MKTYKTTYRLWLKNSLLRLGTAFVMFAVVAGAFSEGFRNPTIGTFGLGRSGGRIAQVDDSTAVQQNPANLIGITNAEIQLTPSVVYISADFQSTTVPGQSASTKDPWKLLPNFFASVPLKNDQVVVGLGVTTPYGLGNEWDTGTSAFKQPTGVFTYFAPHSSQLTAVNFNPSLAVKITDKIWLGAGLDIMWSELEFKQFLSPYAPNLEAHAKGDGVGYGGNLGITYKLTDHQRLALTYRSTMTVDYSGTTKFSSYSGVPSTSFGSQIKFPNIIAAGYGIDLTDTIRLETDFEWIQFSQFKNLPVNVGLNYLSVPSQNLPQNWKDTFTIGIGGDWKFAQHWTLRAGYQYFESPVPDKTFSPTIPDANQNVITLGLGWKTRHHSLEAAYGLDFYDERHISNNQNPAFNGKYTFNVHLFSLAYRYSF